MIEISLLSLLTRSTAPIADYGILQDCINSAWPGTLVCERVCEVQVVFTLAAVACALTTTHLVEDRHVNPAFEFNVSLTCV